MADLPDTDDPFELLGVEPGDDPRTIKRAYARLIKRYRPEQAPAEFQRIHAAYELVKVIARDLAEPPAVAPVPASETHEPRADDDGARSPDPYQALYRLAEDIQAAVLDERFDDVVAALESDEMRRGTLDSAAYELLALRALTALAWREPHHARRLYDELSDGLQHGELESAAEECVKALLVADAWARLVDIPPPLKRFVQLRPVVDGRDADRLGSELHDDLARDIEPYIAFIEQVIRTDERLAVFLSGIGDSTFFVAEDSYSTDVLDDEQRAAIDAALEAIERDVSGSVAKPALWGGAGVAGALVIAGLGGAALVALLAIGGTGLGVQVGRERSQYRDVARAHLARAAGIYGIGRAALVSWIQARRGRYKAAAKFVVPADADDVLLILQGIGRAVRQYPDA